MELHDDLENCEELEDDFYAHRSTTVSRARLCGNCVYYTIKNQLLTCIRCTLDLRPTLKFDENTKSWFAKCPKFQKKS